MKRLDIANELKALLAKNDNHVTDIVINEALEFYFFDKDNLEKDITKKDLLDLQDDLIVYFDSDFGYYGIDMVKDAIKFIDDFDAIFNNSNPNPYLSNFESNYQVTDMTTTICSLYLLAFKIETNNIFNHLLNIIGD